jgi:hypothetical protein
MFQKQNRFAFVIYKKSSWKSTIKLRYFFNIDTDLGSTLNIGKFHVAQHMKTNISKKRRMFTYIRRIQ